MKNNLRILYMLVAVLLAFTACDDDDSANVIAQFSYTPQEGVQVGDTVYFENTSAEAVSFEWNFGDGTTSTEAEPKHVYSAPGVYDVVLTAANGGVSNSVTAQISVGADLVYILNYGSFSGAKSTISAYNRYADEVVDEVYKAANNVTITSNVQYATTYNGKIYLMGNNVDQVFWVDAKSLTQSENAITDQIVKPRYCVAKDNFLYVSCWGGDIWVDESLSYIAKIDLNTKSVAKIELPGGPEGLALVGDKLYAALNYKDSVAVINLADEAISYIATPAVSSYFIEDPDGNLYVSLVSTYSDPSTQAGLGYINTVTDELENVYVLNGLSSSYVRIMSANDDFSKIYVMTSSYDASWNLVGAVTSFDVSTKSFTPNLVEGVTGLNGVEAFGDKFFYFVSETTTGKGKAVLCEGDGTKVAEYPTGISPFMFVK